MSSDDSSFCIVCIFVFHFYCQSLCDSFRPYDAINILFFLCLFTVPPDFTHHLDNNFNQDAGTGSSQEVNPLDNLTSSSPNHSSIGLDQNLNLTLSTKLSPGEGLPPSPSLPQPQPLRPPSLSVLSSLNKPDPTEVDDEAPGTSDSSPESNVITSQDICVDSDLLNGNMSSQVTCETNNTIITWVIDTHTNVQSLHTVWDSFYWTSMTHPFSG